MWLTRPDFGYPGPCLHCGGDLYSSDESDVEIARVARTDKRLGNPTRITWECLLCGREFKLSGRLTK